MMIRAMISEQGDDAIEAEWRDAFFDCDLVYILTSNFSFSF